ncbi:hypothetical protein G5C51_19175 [Streptomyces sp. A7024]|uniref:DUF4352 domain-containing protein n=1 Tax=Streptomyces coryli TaxID=1128680 RepID=A0A6G4U2R9_9ACTN|nr:hypothetical protein [Streptomyces coryli]NGN66006.1 hypothetical protein [Streptomyces coryli]
MPSDAKPIATTEAEAGIIGYIYSVVRDGKFVTVTAAVENTTNAPYMPSAWNDRMDRTKPYTLLGSYLIDKQNALRYPVLRDTDNNCVCTVPFGPMDPKEKRSIFLTFKAPESDRVDVQIGKMAAKPVTITKAGS